MTHRYISLMILASFLFFVELSTSQLVTELYQTCTAIEGEMARCGPGANCFIIDNTPTCHCILDSATGLPLAGNPYKACTWDISGTWQLFSYQTELAGFYREILSPVSNEPFVIRLDRTDAILKTRYITGAIFIVTALSTFSLGVCTRVFLDVYDNSELIFEQSEGFLNVNGRSIFLRSANLDSTLVKKFPLWTKNKDRWNLKGHWRKNDGSLVKVYKFKYPHFMPKIKKLPSFIKKKKKSVYWYNDRSYGAPLLRLSTAIFLDKTHKIEKSTFQTDATFVQIGWYGRLRFGSNRIDIYSPADGKEIFTMFRIDTLPPYTPIGAATALARAFQPSTTSYVGSEATFTVDQLGLEDLENNNSIESQLPDGIEAVERLPDIPAPRTNGGAIGSSRRRQTFEIKTNNLSTTFSRKSFLSKKSNSTSKYAIIIEDKKGFPNELNVNDFFRNNNVTTRKLNSIIGSNNNDSIRNEATSPFKLLWEIAEKRLEIAEAEAELDLQNMISFF